MRVVALSAASWAGATREAAGVEPIVLPGADASRFWPEVALCDVLYVNLHGLEGQPYWYSDGYVTALSARVLAEEDLMLRGVIAFASCCFGVDADGAPGPMVQALLDAGCSAVVAGDGLNYGGDRRARGADVLGQWFVRALGMGWTARRAFDAARGVMLLPALFYPDARDARRFVLLGDGEARAGRGTDAGRDRTG